MGRIKLVLEYDGTDYAGWQRQDNAMTVQQRIEEAVFATTGEAVCVTGASRTDAGVHALGQVAHFDTQSRIPPEKFSYALNTHLPDDVRVLSSCLVASDFHSRFWAEKKQYAYYFCVRPHASALYRNHCWHVYEPLDLCRMRLAIKDIIGTHDFAAFMATGSCVKTTVRTIMDCSLDKQGDFITLRCVGDGFLYNMVRIVAGTLCQIGSGKLPQDTFARMIQSKSRLSGGVTAPAHGLVLEQIWMRQAAFEGYILPNDKEFTQNEK